MSPSHIAYRRGALTVSWSARSRQVVASSCLVFMVRSFQVSGLGVCGSEGQRGGDRDLHQATDKHASVSATVGAVSTFLIQTPANSTASRRIQMDAIRVSR
jgi:hypothetical protein